MEPVRVAVIADSAFILEGITRIFRDAEQCEVMGTLLMNERHWPLFYIPPHVILISATITPFTTLCLVIEDAKRHYSESAILLVGVTQPAQAIAAYINAGINGFLHNDLSASKLLHAVHDVVQYGLILDALFVSKLQEMIQYAPEQPSLASLTEREREVVHLAIKGRSNYEIAADLQVSINTVKTHLRNVYEKLNVTSRAELAVLALSAGMKLSEDRVAYLV